MRKLRNSTVRFPALIKPIGFGVRCICCEKSTIFEEGLSVESSNYPRQIITILVSLAVLAFAALADVQAVTIVCFPMDTNPGWSTQGKWSFGVPLGGGSHCYDPTSGHTNTYVYGYNLSGDYTNDMPSYYLTTTALNCSDYENVTLRFWRWLGVESSAYDHAKVEVSNDESTWILVWEQTAGSHCDGIWVECIYDISAVADDQSTVYIRWTMGPTDGSITYPGWNIDDVCLLGDYMDDLFIDPSEDFNLIGYEGGPFEPNSKDYTLNNSGVSSLDWAVEATCPWLDVVPDSGTLPPQGFVTVTISTNAYTNDLNPNTYTGRLIFRNLSSGLDRAFQAELTVLMTPGEIDVTDSIPPVDDLNMPFGDVFLGLSRTEHVTIANTDSNHMLLVDMRPEFEGFYDEFPDTILDPCNWSNTGGIPTIDNVGLNEPSEPYSLRLNGYPDGGDIVESRTLDLSGFPSDSIKLKYWWQQTGGGESPEPGEDLIIRYWDGSSWIELSRHPGDGPDMTEYVRTNITLPPEALHSEFKLQISSIGTAGNHDDWFVDDVSIVSLDNGNLLMEVFHMENLPDFPVMIPPLGSISFDVNFMPLDCVDYDSVLILYSNDKDEPEVEMRLTGSGIIDYIQIIPDADFVFSGHPGGPFVPSNTSYQLTNIGPVPVDWTVEPNAAWLDVSPSGGTLGSGNSITVIVTPNSQADTMPEGYYGADLLVTNITTTMEQKRRVCLNVYTEPKIWASPYSFNVTVDQGWSDTQILTIGNTGGSVLEFSLSSYQTDFTPLLEQGAAGAMAQKIETSEDKIVLEYEFSEPVVFIDAQGEYDFVQMEGLQAYERTGAPIIPVRPVTVLIPYGKKVVSTRVKCYDTRQLEGTYQLPPAQKPYPLSYKGTVEPTKPDMAVYSRAGSWPGIDHDEVAAQSKRGYQLFSVNLFPLQYVPTTGKVSYSGKLRLEIDLEDAAALGVVRPSDTVKTKLSKTVENVSVLEAYPESDTFEKLGQPTTLAPGGPYRYVIITDEVLEAAPGPWNFQAIRDARIARGMTATIVTTQWIYANYDGTKPDGSIDNQTRIRNFLIDAYLVWGAEYVLLGGTNAIVPARMFWVDGEDMPVDMYYGCVDPAACTFDYNANNYYGEPTDGVDGGDVDLHAEIYVGRAAVQNAAELENFVVKTLTYDSSQSEYLARISMVGEWLDFGGVTEYAKDSLEQIRLGGDYDGYFTYGFENHVQPLFFDFITIGCMPGSPAFCWPLYDKDYIWLESDLINLMNSGVHVFNHLGHASYTEDMRLNISDLSLLTNSDYFFVYSQGCDPGGFDMADCFAEVITSMERGAFAVIMNARSGWSGGDDTDGPSQRFDREFWDAVLGEGILELGRANQDSKEDNFWDIDGDCIRYCYYELNLFGDPAQRLKFNKSGDSSGWISTVPDAGIIAAGQSVDVNVIFNGNWPAGTYCAHIAISSNDPYTSEVIIPVTMTVEPNDYFTQLFDPNVPVDPNDPACNDMAHRTLIFKPDSSCFYYGLCTAQAEGFPVDPNGGTIVSLGDDDYVPVNLQAGACINFYGTDYDTFYIGSNGYISFVSGEISHFETLEDHFALPRISALFDDLNPSAGGLVSWKQLDDRVVVTFENVPEYSLANSNSFQIEMCFDGKVIITFLDVAATDGLVGLSEGLGLPLWFSQSDLSEYSSCNFIGDLNGDFDTDLTDFAVFASYWCSPYEIMTEETVSDRFNSISYSGSDGTQDWSGDWQEIGESDGPDAGDVRVVDSFVSNALRIGRFAEGKGLLRQADLSDTDFAELTFNWWRGGPYYHNNTTVDISDDGGSSWTTLLTIPDGHSIWLHSEVFDISAYADPNTQIRFIANQNGNGYVYFDDIQVEYDLTQVNELWCEECDFNQDFRIDFADLLILVEHWLE